MSFAAELHAAHKERLQRLSPQPEPKKPAPWYPRIAPKPQAIDAGWDCMWFWDVVTGHSKEPRVVRVREIQEAICKHYSVSILDMLSGRRTHDVSFPRQVAMYLCRHLTPHSYAEIGRRFGGRDHTTVIHAAQKIEGLYGYDVKTTVDVNTLRKVLA